MIGYFIFKLVQNL